MSTTTQTSPIPLSWHERDRLVRIEPEDEDRFGLTVAEAIYACRSAVSERTFRRQFEKLLVRLAEWVATNRRLLADAFLSVRDAGLLFLVVQKEKALDEELEEKLVRLDLEVARNEVAAGGRPTLMI